MLQVNASPVVNPVLEVGQVTEQVRCKPMPRSSKHAAPASAQVVENTRILELPLNGSECDRPGYDQRAATPAPLFPERAAAIRSRKATISVAGGMHTGVSYTLDGAYHKNPYTNG